MDIYLRFKHWIDHFTVRTLKVNILTLFLSLTIFTFTCVMVFSFFKNYRSILEFSQGRMERNSRVLLDRIERLQTEVEDSLQDTEGLFINAENLVVENKALISFMVNVIKTNPNLAAFFLAAENGNFIQVTDLTLSTQKSFISDSEKPLPDNTVYSVRLLDLAEKYPKEIWQYRDADFHILATEKIERNVFPVHQRPWYVGALTTSDIFWTDVYPYYGSGEPGISAGKAVYDSSGKLLGVLGADLSFVALNQFMSKLKIGKKGESFIIDNQGNVIVSSDNLQDMKKAPLIVSKSLEHFRKNKKNTFMIVFENTRYLVEVARLPTNFGKDWTIVILAPFSEFFSGLVQAQVQVVLMTLVILLFSVAIIIYFSKRISQPIVTLSKEVDKITSLDLSSKKRVGSNIVEIITIDSSIAAMRATLRSFSKYVPKEIVKQLLKKGKEIGLSVEKKSLTIFFSDIQNFTSIIESNPLEKIMPLLSQYFDGLSRIVLDNNGTIDKYIGDSVMAFWGAPVEISDHAYLACVAALRCRLYVEHFNKKCREQQKPEFITRFGINAGHVVVGNIGTFDRINYTVIGDPVNTASRLQATGKTYQVSIIIGETVYQQVKDRVLARPLDKAAVKGKHEEIKIYELIAAPQEEPEIHATPEQEALCAAFSAAYESYSAGNFKEATQLFKMIHEKFPNDYPTQLYLERLSGI